MIGDEPCEVFAWQMCLGVYYGRLNSSAADAYQMTNGGALFSSVVSALRFVTRTDSGIRRTTPVSENCQWAAL